MSAHEKSKSSFDLLMNRASDVFQALSHPLRLSICFELSTAEQSVSQLCEFTSSATAQHFAASGLAAQTECCQSAQAIAAGFLPD
jgi:hypothetical protein